MKNTLFTIVLLCSLSVVISAKWAFLNINIVDGQAFSLKEDTCTAFKVNNIQLAKEGNSYVLKVYSLTSCEDSQLISTDSIKVGGTVTPKSFYKVTLLEAGLTAPTSYDYPISFHRCDDRYEYAYELVSREEIGENIYSLFRAYGSWIVTYENEEVKLTSCGMFDCQKPEYVYDLVDGVCSSPKSKPESPKYLAYFDAENLEDLDIIA